MLFNMAGMAKAILPSVLILVYVCCCSADEHGCQTPQYLEIGTSGTVVCSFSVDFVSIYWYYNSDSSEGPATLSYENEQRQGEGYTSGEFDIRSDGSLIINNVLVKHEARFTVYELKVDKQLPDRYDIQVVTIVRPTPPHPVIDDCPTSPSLCYIPWKQQHQLICSINQARPAISLTWLARTTNGNMNITDKTTLVSEANTWSSSLSVVNPFMYSSHLAMLVCKADDHSNLLEETEMIILVHNKDGDISMFETKEVLVERNEKIQFPCIDSNYQLIVWERISTEDNVTTNVMLDAGTGVEMFPSSNEYELQDGNLVIGDVELHHEALYRCTYNDGMREGVRSFNLTVYVNPIPGYPIIEGCTHDRYCVLDVSYSGILKCTVRGIRPEVQLEWRAYHVDHSDMISFHGQQVDTRSNGETSDVTITTAYTAKETAERKLTVECRSMGPNSKHFSLNSKVDLLFPGFVDQNTTGKPVTSETPSGPSFKTVPIIVTVCIILLVLIIGAIVGYRVHKRRTKQLSMFTPEVVPLIQNTDSIFISELKSNYENLYSAVKPIPFLQGNFTVHELYVEGGIEYQSKDKRKKIPWEPLDSYQNIFTHQELLGSRWIIEGGPGYGKSTLSVQLAYEWCQRVEGSFMNEIEIFILIRLRQLKGISSIYEAIKRFILPINSKFSVDDIKGFIDNSKSVLIILDGFDEYPDSNSNPNSDVFNIIKRTMLPSCRVALTTRLDHLPKDYAPQTKRVRLTGFKSRAQDEYMQKAVIVNGYKSMENTIKEWLQDNPILGDLCEVPLFFVMYAHLSLESDELRKCTSVTSFFRYMITCLHSHLRLKFRDENVDTLVLSENFHQELDKICFESLNGHSYNPDIEKDYLLQALGKEFVDQYLQIGIFREEKATVVSNEPGVQASDHVKTVYKLRFYHSLFCEWFAAHFLAEALDKMSFTSGNGNGQGMLTILEDLDPSELQYVYRFACGINPRAAKHILEHLKIGHDGVDAFPILCILEQVGNVDTIIDNVREICVGDDGLQVRGHDAIILQRSVVQLMDIATSKEITISKLVLIDCFKLVDITANEIVLYSEVRIPLLNDVKQLMFEQKEREFNQHHLDEIFKYASNCRNLEEINFVYTLLPYRIIAESLLGQLAAKDIKVHWFPSESEYSLDLKSGHWQQFEGSPHVTQHEYSKVATTFRALQDSSPGH
ncbi:uncharacterized protein [Apostichopus japonicus]|uniref:uncharacterized protein n=1 Tax=Stichopus japonicus TaxID=307972 RepID=UPI003AB82A29